MSKDEQFSNIINNDLPEMRLKISKTTVDFETYNLEMSCSGFTVEECKQAMDYLVSKAESVDNAKEKKDTA